MISAIIKSIEGPRVNDELNEICSRSPYSTCSSLDLSESLDLFLSVLNYVSFSLTLCFSLVISFFFCCCYYSYSTFLPPPPPLHLISVINALMQGYYLALLSANIAHNNIIGLSCGSRRISYNTTPSISSPACSLIVHRSLKTQ